MSAQEATAVVEQGAEAALPQPFVGWGGVGATESPSSPARASAAKASRKMMSEQLASAGAWIVVGSDALAALLESVKGDLPVEVAHVEPGSEFPVTADNVVVVELPDANGEAVLHSAKKAGALAVAVIHEPTVQWFARAVRAGARDVLAATPAGDFLANRVRRWYQAAH